eukprot:gene2320-8610_t
MPSNSSSKKFSRPSKSTPSALTPSPGSQSSRTRNGTWGTPPQSSAAAGPISHRSQGPESALVPLVAPKAPHGASHRSQSSPGSASKGGSVSARPGAGPWGSSRASKNSSPDAVPPVGAAQPLIRCNSAKEAPSQRKLARSKNSSPDAVPPVDSATPLIRCNSAKDAPAQRKPASANDSMKSAKTAPLPSDQHPGVPPAPLPTAASSSGRAAKLASSHGPGESALTLNFRDEWNADSINFEEEAMRLMSSFKGATSAIESAATPAASAVDNNHTARLSDPSGGSASSSSARRMETQIEMLRAKLAIAEKRAADVEQLAIAERRASNAEKLAVAERQRADSEKLAVAERRATEAEGAAEQLRDQISTMQFERSMQQQDGGAEMEREARLYSEEQLGAANTLIATLEAEVHSYRIRLADCEAALQGTTLEAVAQAMAIDKATAARDSALARAAMLEEKLVDKHRHCSSLQHKLTNQEVNYAGPRPAAAPPARPSGDQWGGERRFSTRGVVVYRWRDHLMAPGGVKHFGVGGSVAKWGATGDAPRIERLMRENPGSTSMALPGPLPCPV